MLILYSVHVSALSFGEVVCELNTKGIRTNLSLFNFISHFYCCYLQIRYNMYIKKTVDNNLKHVQGV